MYFDTHVHFDGLAAEDGVEGVLRRAAAAGVTHMMAIGGSAEGNAFAASLAATHPARLAAAVGYDRDCAGGDCPASDIEALAASNEAVRAVGEIGLDYHYQPDSAFGQEALFAAMLGVARRRELPVVVHSREADEATLRLLREHAAAWTGAPDCLGVLHCFTGGAAFAGALLELGMMISFSGIVTFRNADALRAVAREVPEDRLLIETDAPYLAPVPVRGRPNEPALVPHVARVLADVRGATVERVAAVTAGNARRLFGVGPTST